MQSAVNAAVSGNSPIGHMAHERLDATRARESTCIIGRRQEGAGTDISQLIASTVIPVVSAVLVAYFTRKTNKKMDEGEERRERARVEAEEDKRRIAAIEKGVRTILWSQLNAMHRLHVSEHFATVDVKKEAERVYGAYHRLGGNGTGTQMYEEIMALPSVEEGEHE